MSSQPRGLSKSLSRFLAKQSVKMFWQSVNWDDAEIVESIHPWAVSVQQYFALIPWAITGSSMEMNVGKLAETTNVAEIQPEKATLENFLDDVSQFF
jgi:hypothetical protein